MTDRHWADEYRQLTAQIHRNATESGYRTEDVWARNNFAMTHFPTVANELERIRAELTAAREAIRGYEGAIEGLSNTIGEQRAQLESIREYAQLLRRIADVTRNAGDKYLAKVYDDTATALERKIGDRA